MPNCDYCQEEIGYLPFRCKYCGGIYCKNHRLPENHECTFQMLQKPIETQKPKPLYPQSSQKSEEITKFEKAELRRQKRYAKQQEKQRARARSPYAGVRAPPQSYPFQRRNVSIYLLLVIFITSIVALVFPNYLCLSSYTILNFYVWTLITSLFVSYSSSYIGILFLLILVLIFYSIIKNLELTFGTRFLLTLYLVCALGSAIVYFLIWFGLSYITNPYDIPVAGLAIGALMGMICFMIYFNMNQEMTFLFFFIPIRMRGKILIWLLILINLIPGLLFALFSPLYLAIYIPDLGGILASYLVFKLKFQIRV